MNSTNKNVVFWLVIVVSALLLWTVLQQERFGQGDKEVNFSQFMVDVDQGNVKEVTINLQEVRGKFANDGSIFHTTVPANYPDMIKLLRDKGVVIYVREVSKWPNELLSLSSLILFALMWFLMNRQWQTAFGKLISPMRQAWINELRKEIAKLSSGALQYFETGHEARKDEDYRRLTELELEIILTMNPHENNHLYLLATIREMMKALERGKGNENEFSGAHKKMTEVARSILSTEWNRV
jgi:hypothetical protein